jgi:hypothetical protein
MPRRDKPDLPPARRSALEAELIIFGELEEKAFLEKCVRVFFAYEIGMTVREIAAVYGVGVATVARWKELGERERARRRRDDPERPGEREQIG